MKSSSYSVFNQFGSRLYHYTSIYTLAEILKNKTIRFNRLDRVNDPQEALSDEYKVLQKVVFASCWTDNEIESIPLWKIYAGLNGIRISMPTLMFQGRNDNHKVTNNDLLFRFRIENALNTMIKGRTSNSGYGTGNIVFVYGPARIRYVNNEELSLNNVYPDESCIKYDFRFEGTRKSKDWLFEQEVRFRIFAISEYSIDRDWMSPEMLSELIIDTEFVDLPLDKSAIDEMEILLGPKVTEAERNSVESLCSKYAPNVRIYSSKIKINF